MLYINFQNVLRQQYSCISTKQFKALNCLNLHAYDSRLKVSRCIKLMQTPSYETVWWIVICRQPQGVLLTNKFDWLSSVVRLVGSTEVWPYACKLRQFKALNCKVLARELAKVLYDEPSFANLKSYRFVVMQFEMMSVTVRLYLGL